MSYIEALILPSLMRKVFCSIFTLVGIFFSSSFWASFIFLLVSFTSAALRFSSFALTPECIFSACLFANSKLFFFSIRTIISSWGSFNLPSLIAAITLSTASSSFVGSSSLEEVFSGFSSSFFSEPYFCPTRCLRLFSEVSAYMPERDFSNLSFKIDFSISVVIFLTVKFDYANILRYLE